MSEIPLCQNCHAPMLQFSVSKSGSITYYCGCVPNSITWKTIHPEKEIPRVKRTGGFIPQGE